jgi:hypothetical protein
VPRAFPFIPGYEHYGIRRHSFRDYLIFHRIEDRRISIVPVVHGARDHEALLVPEENSWFPRRAGPVAGGSRYTQPRSIDLEEQLRVLVIDINMLTVQDAHG